MTIIDTTLYANGALRLSRHGAGRGGSVLMLVATGEQIDIPEPLVADVERYIQLDTANGIGGATAFSMTREYPAAYAELHA